MMDLLKALSLECCTVNLAARTKDQVLLALGKLACANNTLADIGPETIYQYLKERENQGTTGFGNGIALPHARIKGLKEFIVGIAVSPKGVDFTAMDKKKCRLIFFILGPAEDTAGHIKALAGISRQLNKPQVRNELLKATTPTALFESFARRIGGGPEGASTPRAMKLIYVVLYLEDLLYDVLEFFIEQGIDGATIIEGAGMGQYISNVPLFAEFIGFMHEKKNHSQTIMALIPTDREQQIIQGIETITGDMNTTQGAMVMTVDVSFYKGTMRMM